MPSEYAEKRGRALRDKPSPSNSFLFQNRLEMGEEREILWDDQWVILDMPSILAKSARLLYDDRVSATKIRPVVFEEKSMNRMCAQNYDQSTTNTKRQISYRYPSSVHKNNIHFLFRQAGWYRESNAFSRTTALDNPSGSGAPGLNHPRSIYKKRPRSVILLKCPSFFPINF